MKKIIILIVIISIIIGAIFTINKKENIETVLTSEAYSYLSDGAKEYVKDIYEKSGEVVLTEKNKKENIPYLNPKYNDYLSLSKEDQKEVEVIPTAFVVDYSPINYGDSNDLPNYYNITNVNGNNYTTPMYNQGNLGLCWAFTTVEQVESYLMQKNNTSYSPSSERFSIRQMDYATSNNGIKNYNNENGYRLLTGGGNFLISSTIMSYGLSLTDYEEYNESTTQKDLFEVLNYSKSNYELTSAIIMPVLDENTTEETKDSYINSVKQNIMNYGGSYLGTGSPNGNCGFKNTDNSYVIVQHDDCLGTSGHAMQIIGWDDEYEYSYCSTSGKNYSVNNSGECNSGTLMTGTGAWILRNSWGDDPVFKYVYLGYNSYDYEVGFTTSLERTENRTWDNIHHKNFKSDGYYDTTIDTILFDKAINTSEKIEQIKFVSSTSSGEYKLSIESGNNVYKNIKTINTEFPGIYTIDLKDENIILNSSNFKVQITGYNRSFLTHNTISVFTSNVDSTPVIYTEDMDGSTLRKHSDKYSILVYSSTKNIDSNETVTYSLYKNNNDYSNYILSYDNNIVAENNINATLYFNKNIPDGDYVLKVSYNNNVFESNLTIPKIFSYEGTGTMDDPYLIYNEEDLDHMRYNLDAYYLLKNDIYLTKEWTPVGSANAPFRGGLDGDNHSIIGLIIEENSENAVGLFGYVDVKYVYSLYDFGYYDHADTTYFKNLKLEDVEITNEGNAGVLIGNVLFDANNPPEGANNVCAPSLSIDSIYFIDGSVTSRNGDAGVIMANINNVPKSSYTPYLTIDDIYSSITVGGLHSSGLIGYVNDSYESASGIMMRIEMSNIQNVGVIDVKSFDVDYNSTKNYSPIVGGLYGNARLTLNNYIINTIFNDVEYMYNYTSDHELFFIGYNLPIGTPEFSYNVSNGYYVSSYSGMDGLITSKNIKDSSLYNSWNNFANYWKIETIDGIKRIPILKNIDYGYTNIPDIQLEKYDKVSLLDYIDGQSDYQYIEYSVVSNNNIIKVDRSSPKNGYYQDITIEALSIGSATIHIVNNYDGYERDVTVNVIATQTENPVITYYSNDLNNNTYTQQVSASQSFNLTKNQFTRAGYDFIGWNTISDGSGTSYEDEETITNGINEDIRLYAMWAKKEYTVSFNANGGTGTMSDRTVSLNEGSYWSIPLNQFTRDNYKFIGWNTASDGSGISFANNGLISFEQLTSIDGLVMTLYAQWEINTYTITFYANGGSGAMSNQSAAYNTEVKLDKNIFTRTGYTFTGWNTSTNGSGTSYSDEQSITLTGNIELYAQWEINNYTITFYSNGGTGTMSNQVVPYNTQVKLNKNTFTKEYSSFVGWNTSPNGSGTNYDDEAYITVKNNINLYAKWNTYIAIKKIVVNGIEKPIENNSSNTSNITLGTAGVSIRDINWYEEKENWTSSNPVSKFEKSKRYILKIGLNVSNNFVLDDSLTISANETFLKAEYVKTSTDIRLYYEASPIPKLEKPIVNIKANNNELTITWAKQDAAYNYYVYTSNDNKIYSKDVSTMGTNMTYVGLIYGDTYYFKVKACDSNKQCLLSDEVHKKVVPNKVKLNVTSAGTNNVKLSWEIGKVTGYRVYSSTDSKTWTLVKDISGSKTLELNVKSLKANKTYYFRARAYKTVDGTKVYGSYSTVVSTKTAPVKPEFEVKIKSYNSMSLVVGASKGASEYRLYRSMDNSSWERIATLTSEGTYIDGSHDIGRVYYYKVKACNTKGYCSGYVYEDLKQSVKTPKIVVETPKAKKVKITINSVDHAEGYKIYRSEYKNSGYETIAEITDFTNLTFTDKTKSGYTYYYKVRAYSKGYNGKRVFSSYSSIKKIVSN